MNSEKCHKAVVGFILESLACNKPAVMKCKMWSFKWKWSSDLKHRAVPYACSDRENGRGVHAKQRAGECLTEGTTRVTVLTMRENERWQPKHFILSLTSLCCILHHAKYQRRHDMPVSSSCLATKQWLRETDILTRLAGGFLWTARGFGRACGSDCSDSEEDSSLFLLVVLRSDT